MTAPSVETAQNETAQNKTVHVVKVVHTVETERTARRRARVLDPRAAACPNGGGTRTNPLA
ncbi:hypothetical protein E1287_41895, partial [Actinomadura sp. KC06]|uniref:hypothetical protein n=1 Tax=Actinomadura sp. KC06 TaxID=2530369 RepID=UPI0010442666